MNEPRTIVLIPTYNERESLPVTLRRVRDAVPAADVLIIDDASPDGTGEIADDFAAADAQVSVLHRSAKDGLGAAYLAGFEQALDRGYDLIVELDADGSHPPERLPAMLHAAWADGAAGPSLVIGSRWVAGGSVIDWPLRRKILSRGGNTYARVLLGAGVRDITAGYRVYRASMLRALDRSGVESRGYCFQVDMTMRVLDAGGTVVELPIEFRERQAGVSKMSGSIVSEAMVKVAGWGIGRRAATARSFVRRPR